METFWSYPVIQILLPNFRLGKIFHGITALGTGITGHFCLLLLYIWPKTQ